MIREFTKKTDWEAAARAAGATVEWITEDDDEMTINVGQSARACLDPERPEASYVGCWINAYIECQDVYHAGHGCLYDTPEELLAALADL